MYCSVCGNKLSDNEQFCTNCGSKVERIEETVASTYVTASSPVTVPVKEEPIVNQVVEEIKAPEVEVTPISEPVKEEPIINPVVEEIKAPEVEVTPISEPVKEEPIVNQVVEEIKAPEPEVIPVQKPVVSEPTNPIAEEAKAPEVSFAQKTVKVDEQEDTPIVNVINANGPIIENPNPESVKESQKEAKKKKKKKAKPWVIVLLVILIIIVVIALIVGIATVVFVLFGVGGLGLGVWLIGDGKPVIDDSYLDTIDKYYGDYNGVSKVTATYNSESLIDYLDSLGIEIDEDTFYTDVTENEFAISIYEDSSSEAAWDMIVYLGDYIGYTKLNNLHFVKYDDLQDRYYELGDININSDTEEFIISVSDTDHYNLINDMLQIDSDDECEYTLKFTGIVEDGVLDGYVKVTFLYDGMEKPFSEDIEVHAVLNE